MSELLRLGGEIYAIGDVEPADLKATINKPALILSMPGGRSVMLVGLTHDECRECLPAFMSPARITVSAA